MKPLAACVALALCIAAPPGSAQGRAPAEWKGYVGGGAIAYPRYTGGRGTDTIAAPLLLFEYRETVYVDLVRAGVRFWSSADRSMALGIGAEPRFGRRETDGARLAGTARRRDSIELGPTFEWETPVASLSLAWFGDVNGSSRGQSVRASVWRQFIDSGAWDLGGYVSADRSSARVVDYFFGVRPDEATAARAAYSPGAATHWTAGVSGAYRFSPRYALVFGVQSTRLGASAAASPITETRGTPMGYLGLGWRL